MTHEIQKVKITSLIFKILMKYTKKILTFSSELKMFFNIERYFKVKNVFIWL